MKETLRLIATTANHKKTSQHVRTSFKREISVTTSWCIIVSGDERNRIQQSSHLEQSHLSVMMWTVWAWSQSSKILLPFLNKYGGQQEICRKAIGKPGMVKANSAQKNDKTYIQEKDTVRMMLQLPHKNSFQERRAEKILVP